MIKRIPCGTKNGLSIDSLYECSEDGSQSTIAYEVYDGDRLVKICNSLDEGQRYISSQEQSEDCGIGM